MLCCMRESVGIEIAAIPAIGQTLLQRLDGSDVLFGGKYVK